ncbi:DUF4297 domain-containing protein [Halobacillus sp. A1]|uniref:DUF4297 domain-containing protein n=1 Tax=Halobacillus sp. A1 TaxID=2880262 RepID=UPI0020A6626D|nr:DUF4297 domain-containing protein [Halobacillus sp. A1]MCP3032655.1 DUF4297 domain-containing protein [Halobacillus sp. A1]
MAKNFEESTSADKTSLGFEYQHYYFIYQLLKLKKGESLGYEVKDDVHIEKENMKLDLIQVKHTLKENKSGTSANLTELDVDLWKTLSNWISQISEKSDNNKFIENSNFILATNKNESVRNKFLSKLTKYQKEEIDLNALYSYTEGLLGKTQNKEIKKYIRNVLSIDEDNLSNFFLKINFEYALEDIIQMIKDEIKNKYISEERIEQVLYCIEGNTRIWKYDQVKKYEKIIITYDEAFTRLKKCFEDNHRRILPKRNVDTTIDEIKDLKQLPFIKQLIDIDDIEEDDFTQMAEYNTYMLKLKNNMERWIAEGELTEIDRKDFIDNSYTHWSNVHKRNHREINRNLKRGTVSISEDEKIDAALKCLDEIRDISLNLDGTELGIQLSNGQFYYLSNDGMIGWIYDWKEKYG